MSMLLLGSSRCACNTLRSYTKIFEVNGGDPGLVNLDVGNTIWGDYIPSALAKGAFQAKPDPLIISGGLNKVQDGMDILAKGVSAQKIVVEILKD